MCGRVTHRVHTHTPKVKVALVLGTNYTFMVLSFLLRHWILTIISNYPSQVGLKALSMYLKAKKDLETVLAPVLLVSS